MAGGKQSYFGEVPVAEREDTMYPYPVKNIRALY
jgi:hypothetical protein